MVVRRTKLNPDGVLVEPDDRSTRQTHPPYPSLLLTHSTYFWLGALEKESLTSSACPFPLEAVLAMPWSSLPCELRLQVLESAVAHELTSYDELEYGGPALQARAHAVSLIRSVCHEWRVRFVGLVRPERAGWWS